MIRRMPCRPVTVASIFAVLLALTGSPALSQTNGNITSRTAALEPGEAWPGGAATSNSAKLVADELETALNIALSFTPAPKAFPQGKAAQPLIAMGFPLKHARDQTALLLAITAGLSMGFNASDGD